MTSSTIPPELIIEWDIVPNPDPYALLKAVALVLRRRVPFIHRWGFDCFGQDANV